MFARDFLKDKLRWPVVLLVILSFAVQALSASDISDKEVQKVLGRLDRELDNREFYKRQREEGIDSIKQKRARYADFGREWLGHTLQIAVGYSSFDNDSALYYYTQGLEKVMKLEDDSIVNEFRIRRATYLSISGYINDAINEFNMIDSTRLSEGEKQTYYSSSRQLFSYISTYYDGFISTYDYWNNRAVEAQKALLPYLERASIDYRLNLGEYLYSCREYVKSRRMLMELIREIDPDTSAYAIACHILASIARTRGDRNEHLYYLALSAIADTRMGTLEVTSIQELGGVLFELGDTRRAHDYLVVAMNNVVESRASVRLSQTSELLTVIENDHLNQIAQWRTLMYIILAILLVCLFALMAAIYFLRRELTRVAQMKRHLEESNKTKEVYIGKFLTLCSIYMDKLKQFCKLVNRKISAGQVDDLFKITKSGKFIDEQSKEFYSVFDDAFLHIYPSFVEKVNELLRPEERIVLAEGELLNSDLRILAFMRLGIEDATRVAQILNYSVNTIYAYRNKLRNRAINRETFEADIQAIGAS